MHTHNKINEFCNCVASLVRIDFEHSEINSNTDRRLGGDSNGLQCQPCDADAIDGEDSPLQSKRSSRFLIFKYLKSTVYLLFIRVNDNILCNTVTVRIVIVFGW